ncbi:hypothetical protein [Oribacterium sp. WCC10]|uniref:hypothetical protein n=1 Tax=Oribacterium sp. WCC10 TaxID=1855343 RepID=UPI0008DEDD0C|nr:hypothetical protein [Oribacterium sp. WCC10]SFG06760.1 hypothetical protein SAMN05216356_10173 [Oribacterium sp. WCC10]
MNFVFLSPNYPDNYWKFCRRLKENGVNVLGIGDASYDELSQDLTDSLTEYYRVDNLIDYEQVYRAAAFLSYKYGKIDWIESMNEYWLYQDAGLRTDFNIKTGMKNEELASIKDYVLILKRFAEAGIPVYTRDISAFDITASPVEAELCSYDAIVDSHCEPLFESMTVWAPAKDNAVHADTGEIYYTCPDMPAKLRSLGRKALKVIGTGSRFMHIEFLRLTKDHGHLGKTGEYIAVNASLCPAGGAAPDMMNYAHSVDVYKIWADMITTDRRYLDGRLQTAAELKHYTSENTEDCFCVYASRREGPSYVYPESRIADKFHDVLMMRQKVTDDNGTESIRYAAKLRTQHEVNTFIRFLHETNPQL